MFLTRDSKKKKKKNKESTQCSVVIADPIEMYPSLLRFSSAVFSRLLHPWHFSAPLVIVLFPFQGAILPSRLRP